MTVTTTVTTGPVRLEGEAAERLVTHLLTLSGMKIIPTGLVGRYGVVNCVLFKRGMEAECYLSVIVSHLDPGQQKFQITFQEGRAEGRVPFVPRTWWVIEWVVDDKEQSHLSVLLEMFHKHLIATYSSQSMVGTTQGLSPDALEVSRVFARLV